MHRIDGPGATVDNLFTEGDPLTATPATVVTAAWLNALQEEMAGVVEGAGETLDKEDNAQLLAAIQALIDATVAPAAAGTGDIRLTLRDTAPAGWVMMDDGSIGPSGSGGTTRANDDTEALYKLLWNNITDTYAPVAGGRGLDADADWAAEKLLTLPRTLGRALGIAGAGADLTSRSLGQHLGAETHTLTGSEMPAHVHADAARYPDADADVNYTTANGVADTGNGFNTARTGSQGDGQRPNTSSTGGDGAHNNMQPTAFMNVMIKL